MEDAWQPFEKKLFSLLAKLTLSLLDNASDLYSIIYREMMQPLTPQLRFGALSTQFERFPQLTMNGGLLSLGIPK